VRPAEVCLAIFGPTRVRACVRGPCVRGAPRGGVSGGRAEAENAHPSPHARTHATPAGAPSTRRCRKASGRVGRAGGPPCARGAIGPTRLRRCFPSTAARRRGQRVATRHSMLQRGAAHRRAWCRAAAYSARKPLAASATQPDRSKRAIAAGVYGDREGRAVAEASACRRERSEAAGGSEGARRREGARERARETWLDIRAKRRASSCSFSLSRSNASYRPCTRRWAHRTAAQSRRCLHALLLRAQHVAP
jgi:hypothetical protein